MLFRHHGTPADELTSPGVNEKSPHGDNKSFVFYWFIKTHRQLNERSIFWWSVALMSETDGQEEIRPAADPAAAIQADAAAHDHVDVRMMVHRRATSKM